MTSQPVVDTALHTHENTEPTPLDHSNNNNPSPPPPPPQFRIPSKWRSTVASHYADLVNRSRSNRSPPRARSPDQTDNAPLTLTSTNVALDERLRIPTGSRQLLHILDDAAARPTASPQHQALAVLITMYSEAMASATMTEKDPLRFSESALVISTCDSFMQAARDFCSGVEKSIAAAIPDAASAGLATSSDSANGGHQRPPTRGIEDRPRFAAATTTLDEDAVAQLGSRSAAQSASMQESVRLMKSRFDALACSFNAVLSYVAQLETMLRSATDFRSRVADVLNRCHSVTSKLHDEGFASLTQVPTSSKNLSVSVATDQLQQAAVYEAESDLEFRIVHRFIAAAKKELPVKAAQRGIVEGGPAVEPVDLLKTFSGVVDDFFKTWKLRWDSDRRDRQQRTQKLTQNAVEALREVQRLRAAALASAAQQVSDADMYAASTDFDDALVPLAQTPPMTIFDAVNSSSRTAPQPAPLGVVLEQLRASGLRTTPLVARRTMLHQQHQQRAVSPPKMLPRARTPHVGVTPLARAVAAARIGDLRATFDGSDATLVGRGGLESRSSMVPMTATSALPALLGTPSPWEMDVSPDEELERYRNHGRRLPSRQASSRPSSRQQNDRTAVVSGAHIGAAGRVGSAVLVSRASKSMVRVAGPFS